MDFNLRNKTAVITGSASGIGRSVAVAFAGLGAKIVLLDKKGRGLEELCNAVENKGAACLPYIVDLTDIDALNDTFGNIFEKLDRLDILVNSAGIWEYKLFSEMNDYDLNRMMQINFQGYFNVLKCVVPRMIEQLYGKIICLSSVAGKVGSGVGASHYAASKGAIIAFIRSLAKEVGKYGINANVICPGLIDTPITGSSSMLAKDAYVKNCILKRLGKPEEVAAVAAFLASDLSSFVTGQAWNVCGGYIFD
ncbi:MAG: SDR family NAD(P)-dependent oxidoreductase [Dehalococcoidales bacterium]|jgi:3-oxoacyl-[acyl-carrier protein] reductase|nr:SDR family oxidoreductase [Syntrophales bacterium]MDX9803397.1 SDR family NAD(P)-dependent oxidoreductase [Dehalococcoidales bacterium]